MDAQRSLRVVDEHAAVAPADRPFLFVAFGTRGDVFPLFLLARTVAMQRRVTFVTHAAHAASYDWHGAGIQFVGTGTDPLERASCVGEEYEPAVAAAPHCSCVVFSLFALGAWSIAEAFGLRSLAATPCLIPYAPPAGFGASFSTSFPRLYARLLSTADDSQIGWAEVEHWMWPLWTERWGDWRRERLGLCEVPMADAADGACLLPPPTPLLYGFSPLLAPPPHWPRSVVVCGAWLEAEAEEAREEEPWECPVTGVTGANADVAAKHLAGSELEDLLAGPPLLYVGFGSASSALLRSGLAAGLARAAVAVAREEGLCVLLHAGGDPALAECWRRAVAGEESSRLVPGASGADGGGGEGGGGEGGGGVGGGGDGGGGEGGGGEGGGGEGGGGEGGSGDGGGGEGGGGEGGGGEGGGGVADGSGGCATARMAHIRTGTLPLWCLLPCCALALHHGGSGTVATCLRAAIPQIVLPLFFDQPSWAERVEYTGVGARLAAPLNPAVGRSPARTPSCAQAGSADGTAPAVGALLDASGAVGAASADSCIVWLEPALRLAVRRVRSDEVRSRCAELAGAMRRERGLATAAALLRSFEAGPAGLAHSEEAPLDVSLDVPMDVSSDATPGSRAQQPRDGRDIPRRKVLVEGGGAAEHAVHGSDGRDIPRGEVLVEGGGAGEHAVLLCPGKACAAECAPASRGGGGATASLMQAAHAWKTKAEAKRHTETESRRRVGRALDGESSGGEGGGEGEAAPPSRGGGAKRSRGGGVVGAGPLQGGSPVLSFKSTAAPDTSSNRTTPVSPLRLAIINAVCPLESLKSTIAPEEEAQLLRLPNGIEVWCRAPAEALHIYHEIWPPSSSYLPRGSGLVLPTGAGLIVDVGANIGLFSLWAARGAPLTSLIAVEPAPPNAALLSRNLARAGLTARVAVAAVALGAAPGRAELRYYDAMPGNSTLFPVQKWAQRVAFRRERWEAMYAGRAYETQVLTLSALLRRHCGSRVEVEFGLYKILFCFDACVHESIILLSLPPTCTARTIAILLHVYCAIYDAPPDPPCVCHTTYNIGNNNIV